MLLTACDEKYLQEAKILIKSCAKHAPLQRFYLFLVNTLPKHDSIIRSWHPRIIIEHVEWLYDAKNWRGIMCCARSIPLQKVLEEYKEPTIYLDSDIIVRKPLTELFFLLETSDLLVKYRPDLKHTGAAGTPYGSTFNNGVVAVRPSPAGIHFTQEYNRALRKLIDSDRPIDIYREEYKIHFVVDQELLYVTYLKLQDELVFKPLPTTYNDAKFDPASIIWHGKGTAREHPHYVKEKLYFTNKFLFYFFSVYVTLWDLLRAIKHAVIAAKHGSR